MTDEQLYRAGVYCGFAIMHMYRDDVSPYIPGETYGAFAERNAAVLKRVFDEMLSTFSYELSHKQMGAIVAAYCEPPVRLANTQPFKPSFLERSQANQPTER